MSGPSGAPRIASSQQSQLSAVSIATLVSLFNFGVCYLRSFVFPNIPLLPWGDAVGFLNNGNKIVAGHLPYRDYFAFLPPGTELTYALLIRGFGPRSWIPNLMELFPAENLRIYLYEEYRQAPTETLANIFQFLEVNPRFFPDISEKYLQTSVPRFTWVSYMLKKYGVWSPLKSAIPALLLPVLRKWVLRNSQTAKLESAGRPLFGQSHKSWQVS